MILINLKYKDFYNIKITTINTDEKYYEFYNKSLNDFKDCFMIFGNDTVYFNIIEGESTNILSIIDPNTSPKDKIYCIKIEDEQLEKNINNETWLSILNSKERCNLNNAGLLYTSFYLIYILLSGNYNLILEGHILQQNEEIIQRQYLGKKYFDFKGKIYVHDNSEFNFQEHSIKTDIINILKDKSYIF